MKSAVLKNYYCIVLLKSTVLWQVQVWLNLF
jgi:hypothetical protein